MFGAQYLNFDSFNFSTFKFKPYVLLSQAKRVLKTTRGSGQDTTPITKTNLYIYVCISVISSTTLSTHLNIIKYKF